MFRLIAIALLSLGLLPFSAAQAATEKYVADKAHSSILFFVNHLGFSRMVGEFHDFDAELMFDEENPTASSLQVAVRTASVDTDVDELDEKLVKPEHMNANKFPEARFVSSEVRAVGEDRFHVLGDFTLFGETRPMILDVTLNATGLNPFSRKPTAGFSVTTSFLRSDYGFTSWFPGVGDEVAIMVEMEMMRAD